MKKQILAIMGLFAATVTFAAQPIVIDVRTPEEFAQEHVENAENIPLEKVQETIASVSEDKDTPIYLYCRSGNRAGKAQKQLEAMGYTHVVNLGSVAQARTYLQTHIPNENTAQEKTPQQ